MIGKATSALGGQYDGGLVLLGEGTAYPHGSRKPQAVERGMNVLFDCGCDGARLPVGHLAQLRVGAPIPTAEQRKVWDQMARGQQIANAAAKVGAPPEASTTRSGAPTKAGAMVPGTSLPGLSHRTGHGIGMEGHEPVNLVHGEMTRSRPACAFRTSPAFICPASSESGSRIAST